jgi:threonine aldolase
VIAAALRPHQAALGADTAHINVHETGAIEATGHKVIGLPTTDGKIRGDQIRKTLQAHYADAAFEHTPQPKLVYISNPTELGTIYSLAELEDIHAACKEHNLYLFVDGARLGYGLAAQGTDVTLKDVARLCDVFYIGGTKVGALFGEAVVATRPGLLKHFFPLIKQHGALLAKGRLLGIQFDTLFTNNLYQTIASHAIAQAMKLKQAFVAKGYRLFIDSFTNQQFIVMPNEQIDRLMKYATFELWGPRGESETVVRFVTSWATTDEAIDELIERL